METSKLLAKMKAQDDDIVVNTKRPMDNIQANGRLQLCKANVEN